MAKKYYAIKKGYNSITKKEVRDIVVESWNECLAYVKGVKGAIYKSFESLNEVEKYLSDENRILKKGIDKYPQDAPHAYVDGTFNIHTGKYGYGLAIVQNDVIIHIEKGVALDDSEKSLRQIPGELMAAVKAVEYAVSKELKEIVIFHDYEGICHHATGAWERKDKSSQQYYEKINKMKNDNNLKIAFVKVDSHTNDIYNEIADEEAKSAAGLEINRVVENLVCDTNLKVLNETVKEKLEAIISPQYIEKISIINSNLEINYDEHNEVYVNKALNFNCDEDLGNYLKALNKEELEKLALNLCKKLHNIL